MIILAVMFTSFGLNSVVAWVPSIEIQEGSTLYVKSGATGNNDGSSWTDAYTDLQDALANAEADEEIWVAEGTYVPTTGTDRTATFLLPSGVAIYGGFPADGGAWEDRDWETNLTILSGDIGIEDDNADNSYHVVTANGVDVTTILNGFIIGFGHAIGDASNYYGGGMVNTSSSPTLKNIVFLANMAGSGGGMYNTSSSPSLENVTFSINTALDSGGGMYNTSFSNPTLTNVTFSYNSAQFGGGMDNRASSPILTDVTFSVNTGSQGGGMHNKSSDPTLTGVTFSDNSAQSGGGMCNDTSFNPTLTDVTFSHNSVSFNGGGMYNTSSNPALKNVIFSENSAGFYGGGMHNTSSSPTLADVTFSGNVAQYGGGMYDTISSPTMTNITFSENSASFFGGGMYNNSSSSPTLMNVAFSDNSAQYGGGMYNTSSSPALTNITFSENSASYYGGGIYNNSSSNLTITNVTFSGNFTGYEGGGMYNTSSSPTLMNVTFIHNSANRGGGIYNVENSNPALINAILWGNSNGQVVNNAINPSSPTIKYSAIQGGCPTGSDCDNILNEPPLLGDLANNGGFTLTHALPADSPAIDAGDPNNCPALDQRGVTRPIDGDGDKVAICDMGSYEFDTFTLISNVDPAGGGMVELSPDQAFYKYGDEVTLTAKDSDGYSFANWRGDINGATNPMTVTISGYTDITADFTQDEYTLDVAVNPPGQKVTN